MSPRLFAATHAVLELFEEGLSRLPAERAEQIREDIRANKIDLRLHMSWGHEIDITFLAQRENVATPILRTRSSLGSPDQRMLN